MRIAIPSSFPGGLEAGVHGHFGHCDVYTVVDVEGGAITRVGTLPPVPHEQGGCLAAVAFLAEAGVTALVAGGLGKRPLMGFNQAGIAVYRGAGVPTVGAAVGALLGGSLEVFSGEFTCGGGHHH
ncbi:NifB/NifX family molybdenum-iron cluster-binding protein [Mesoterricola silvestris]|uniref:Dinitrogenase iron-molybdenum cofactor biosynthesis n=1 Tax=Mesoterricola silvestris TaxID=2927979 RepID=A0AA48GNI9_9BACT|nr:NifB/NifX family molybdenum-iron cluster-binding protein [Mesoterricola silvestris]BDU72790.1 dinitrogenase iron-molybdenum cofactor biosynthesis [Mesoterricola silvestris]